MNKQPLLYFCSNGLGENLQASPAMRALREKFFVIMVCRIPINMVIHPDCCDRIVIYSNDTALSAVPQIIKELAAANESNTVDLKPTPWTAHLDPQEQIKDALVARGLIYEHHDRRGPGFPTSATRCFWHKILDVQPPATADLLMHAAPPELQREGDYQILVSSGSAEKARRLPEPQAVMLCNQLLAAGFSVCLHTAGGKPEGLHSKCGVALNRWNTGTMEQLKELVRGVQLVIGPDSGTNHLALAYGKQMIFLESRESWRHVIDPVYYNHSVSLDIGNPDCLQNCAARRQPIDQWPAKGTRPASKEYPHNLECFPLPAVPCLKFDAAQIAGIVQTAKNMLE